MRSGLKAAVVLLVTLPVLAYVGGRLAAAPPDPGPRTPVILDGSPTQQPSPRDERDDEQDERGRPRRQPHPDPGGRG